MKIKNYQYEHTARKWQVYLRHFHYSINCYVVIRKYNFACSFNGTISHAAIFGNRQIHIKILNGGSKVIPNHFLLFLKFCFEYRQTGVALFPNISAMEIILIVFCSWKIFISLASPSRPQPKKNTRICSPLNPGG